MCTVLLLPRVNPITLNNYINISVIMIVTVLSFLIIEELIVKSGFLVY